MPTFKYGDVSTLTLAERITTPSIHLQKDGNNWYVPLFSGDKGAVVESGDYNYTLGSLKVGELRAAISRVLGLSAKVICFGSITWYLTKDGDLYGCGYNNYGQQGSGDTAHVLTFTKRVI